MDPCVTCGTTEETTSVCTCDCQCLETARRSGCREIKLIAPTRDTATAWAENDPIVPEGVFFLVKDRLFEGSLEYAIGDGESKYSELTMLYAGAPLSRIGAENHSPLAASGKSTLDPSWLPAATSSALGAVMVSTTGAAGKVPIPASGSSTLDLSWLPTSTTGAAGKIPVPASGQTALDPSWLPAATSSTLGGVMASTTKAANNVVKADGNGSLAGWKDAIINAIIASDGSGGLATDANGNMVVDFDQMPTDKFEALLKSLKMQIPLSHDTPFYVDQNHANASDNINDIIVSGVAHKRGLERNYPFETIRACVEYVTQNYAVGKYHAIIYVASGTYQESITLPTFTRTTGYNILCAEDNDNPPTITNVGAATTPVRITGGTWYLRRLVVSCAFSDPADGVPHYPGAVQADGGSTVVILYGCALSATYTGAASANAYDIRFVLADGGSSIGLATIAGYKNSLSCTKGNATHAYMIHALRGGKISVNASTDEDDGIRYDIPCSGDVTVFAKSDETSRITRVGAGTSPQFSGTVTGQRYSATGNSAIISGYGFPGTIAGTVESSTYSWYSGPNLDA